jgi:hypothetical protein
MSRQSRARLRTAADAMKRPDSAEHGGSKPPVKRFISGVMRKTQWRKLALSLMDSWLAGR